MASGSARRAGARLTNLLYGSINSSTPATAASWTQTGLAAGWMLGSMSMLKASALVDSVFNPASCALVTIALGKPMPLITYEDVKLVNFVGHGLILAP
ncbi:hypothetical protein AXG93_1231s1280 [Marchantia polymorpha subsp. ruderalis]|uniref:Uncharacterized protein n=1 Tax=Marchantia polymorpha subsp. ruderalis TaxID=1480154 RepID=A0A176VSI7_MARPO|nr:hypothetical protein AXG93_1231s1280 [Marchantia polymorpha subsp. ruderalis]